MITILVAWGGKDRVIGKNGALPWHNSEDLKLFKSRTKNQTVIFGRKTYDGLPKRPLPDRFNIVVMRRSGTTQPEEAVDGLCGAVVFSIEQAIDLSKQLFPNREIFFCGGARIYRQALESGVVDRMLVSVIPGEHSGDTYFPELVGWQGRVIENHGGFDVWEYRK